MDDLTDLSKQAEIWHNIASEDGTLKYDFMISLQKIAMTRIVSSLWINQNTQQQLVNLFRRRKMILMGVFMEIEDDIVAKLSQLLLPNTIYEDLKYLVSRLGRFIVDWMNYHDDHVLLPENSEYSAVDLIYNITWTARGKIDYLKTAKNILGNSNINLCHKYKLIYTYCLEDEISRLSPTLINKFHLSSMAIDVEPMACFWTAQITDDMTQLNNARYFFDSNRRDNTMSVNERIIQLLIKRNYGDINKTLNDIPIRFMWSKLSKEEKAKNIALFKNVDNPDFIISFLSNLDYDQQKKFLKECSKVVLLAILNDWWWWGYYFLPTALNVLDILDPQSFWSILHQLNLKKGWHEKMYDHFNSIFKLLWQKSSIHLKEFIFHNKINQFEELVINLLNWERDMDVVEVLLKDLNTQQKKNIAFGNDGIERCVSFIKSDKWDLLDAFIKCTLYSEEDISQLKQKLIQHSGRRIAISFLRNGEFRKIECFLKWAFKSEGEISNFLQSLNYTIPIELKTKFPLCH